jgi:hypothetical protein
MGRIDFGWKMMPLKGVPTDTQYLGLTHISHIQDGQVASSHGSHINMKPRLENLRGY